MTIAKLYSIIKLSKDKRIKTVNRKQLMPQWGRSNQNGGIFMNIICICNQKGGVGKTTTAYNLSAALALKEGKKVLAVDIDPQANLSDYLCYKPDGRPTITHLVTEMAVNGMISADTVRSAIRYNETVNLYYIPSDINLASSESLMATALARETILKRILSEKIISDYDFVLIDCLPSLGTLLINALTVADNVLIPVQTQKFSIDGLTALESLYQQVRMSLNPKLRLIGVLPTMTDRTRISRTAVEILGEKYGETLFSRSIGKSVEAAKSAESRKPLCESKNRLGEDYTELAKEIIART